MLKILMTTAAAAALMTSAALAQAPTSPAGQPPAASQSGTPAAAGTAMGGKEIVTEQKSDQMLASKFKGTDVIGNDDQKIGDVNDVLFDKNGKILAYVIGVGGFLGIGSKDVALSPASFQLQPATDKDEMKLKLSMSKDELKQAAEFKVFQEPSRATTGQSPATRDRVPATPPAQR